MCSNVPDGQDDHTEEVVAPAGEEIGVLHVVAWLWTTQAEWRIGVVAVVQFCFREPVLKQRKYAK